MSSVTIHPQLIPILPLIFTAWNDKSLSPTEIEFIKEKLHTLKNIGAEQLKTIDSWLNPSSPPSDDAMKNWYDTILSKMKEMDSVKRKEFISWGAELGHRMQLEGIADWDEEALERLQQLERFVGAEPFMDLSSDSPNDIEINDTSETIHQLHTFLENDKLALKAHVFRILRDPVFSFVLLRDKQAYREKVLDWCRLLADQGWGGIHFPTEFGGEDDMPSFAKVFETIGYHDLSLVVKFGVQFGLFGGAIARLGNTNHHKTYLKDVASLALPGCFAMTETGHGSDVNSCETTLTYDSSNDQIIIHTPNEMARKDYIGNAALHARLAVVFGQLVVDNTCHGVHAVIVPIRDENGHVLDGVSIEDCQYKLGLNGVDNGRIRFNKVSVPRENLLDRFGGIDQNGGYFSPIENPNKRFFSMLGTLVGGRICVPKAALSASKVAVTIAVRYALHRRQFKDDGDNEVCIMDYPSHQRRLIPLLSKAYAYHIALDNLAFGYDQISDGNYREIETLAAGLKARVTSFATYSIQACREACGGQGYLHENRFADLKADSDIFTTFEGDNTVLLQLVSKNVLSAFKKEHNLSDWRSIISLFASMWVDTIKEKNFIHTHNIDQGHLRSKSYHRDLLLYRKNDLCLSAIRRLQKYRKRGLSFHQTFLKCQEHLIILAHAHIDLHVVSCFQDQLANSQSKMEHKTASILDLLYNQFVLQMLFDDGAWYLKENCFSSKKWDALRKQLEKLNRQLRPFVGQIVSGFGIPEHSIGAPIARK